ncbi:MAG: hypothetical protein Q4F54_05310 [Coriobacteriia bacterium]|nr:hypothetical protein [Coriobacteriia bacterium]
MLDNTGSSPFSEVASNITTISFSDDFLSSTWTTNLRSCDYWFSNMTNLTTLDVSKFKIPNVVSTNSMFEGCTNLAKINSGDNDD